MSDTMPWPACWTVRGAREVITTDAPPEPDLAGPDGVFHATHNPMSCLKSNIASYGNDQLSGQLVTQDDVLETLMGEPFASGMLFLPVLGQSGSGKSHLVRWVYSNLPPDADGRKDVYIPKADTRLRTIIEKILEGLEGPEFEELKGRLAQASMELNESQLVDMLLARLAEAVESNVDSPAGAPATVTEEIRKVLRNFLDDPAFRHRMRDEGHRFYRYAHSVLGAERSSFTASFDFHEDDLFWNDDDFSRELGLYGRKVAARFQEGDARNAAVTLLNENLQAAVQALVGLDTVSLDQVLNDVRRVLKQGDRELLIAIEDFTVLQGIERHLLQALTVNTPDVCTTRVIMAMTPGPFLDSVLQMDTVRTRLRDVFSMDVAYGEGESNLDVVESVALIGRYLNAARVGAKELDESRAGHSGPQESWSPQNHCETCEYVESCHEAFGKSEDGFGLYPFNEDAIKTIIPMAGSATNPRSLLNTTRDVLLQKDQIENRQFPERDNFLLHICPSEDEPPSLAVVVREGIRAQVADQHERERLQTVVQFWGGNPAGQEEIDLHHAVYATFGVSPVMQGRKPRSPSTSEPDPPSRSYKEDEEYKKTLQEITRWADDGATMVVADGGADIRDDLWKQLTEGLVWPLHIAKRAGRVRRRNVGVSRGREPICYEDAESVVPATIKIGSSQQQIGGGSDLRREAFALDPNEDAAILVWLWEAQNAPTWEFAGSPPHLRRLCRKLEEWESEVEALARTDGGAQLEILMLRVLVVTSLVTGDQKTDVDGMTNSELLKQSLRVPPPEVQVSQDGRSNEWKWLMQKVRSPQQGLDNMWSRRDVVEQLMFRVAGGLPQATGGKQGVHFLDRTLLESHLVTIRGSSTLTLRSSSLGDFVPSRLEKYIADLNARVEKAVKAELTAYKEFHSQVLKRFSQDGDVLAVYQAASDEKFMGYGTLPQSLRTVRESTKTLRTFSMEDRRNLEWIVEKGENEDPWVTASRMAALPREKIQNISVIYHELNGFLAEVEAHLKPVEDDASEGNGGQVGSGVDQISIATVQARIESVTSKIQGLEE